MAVYAEDKAVYTYYYVLLLWCSFPLAPAGAVAFAVQTFCPFRIHGPKLGLATSETEPLLSRTDRDRCFCEKAFVCTTVRPTVGLRLAVGLID